MTGTPWTNPNTLVVSAVQAGTPIADIAPCVGLSQESLSLIAISAERVPVTTTDDAVQHVHHAGQDRPPSHSVGWRR